MDLLFSEKRLVFKSPKESGGTIPASVEVGKPKSEKKETAAEKEARLLREKKAAKKAAIEKAKTGLSGLKLMCEKLSPAQLKKAKEYMGGFSEDQVKTMLKKSETTSIFDLRRGGTLRLQYEKEKDPKKKAELKKQLKENFGYAQMTAQFAKEKKTKDGRMYLEVDLKGIGRYEQQLGAGHICPPTWVKVAIEDTSGNIKKGYRKVPGVDQGISGTKIGYYTETGEYLPVYSGYKIYPLEIKDDSTRLKKEQEFYKKEKQYESKGGYRQSLDVSSENFTGKVENRYFVRSLSLVETKDKQKYYHIVTRAKIDPDNGIRKMKGRWNERLALDWATDLENRFGVPRLMTLGTSILESGRGYNRLSYEFGNYFGIKPWGKLHKKMRGLARSKYPEYRELGDFSNGGRQDHMHYADAWSSFVRYSQLISGTGRYRHALQYKDNPMMALACIALSGYCPSNSYIRSVGRVYRRLGKKYGIPIGHIDYPELVAHMKRHNPSRLTEDQIRERVASAARDGFVSGFPG